MAGQPGAGHVPPHAGAQVHHDAAGRGHRVPGNGHQPAGGRGLGDDAELLWAPFYVSERNASNYVQTICNIVSLKS